MQKETKKERFDRISEARKIKILDGIRLLENCSNKSNYEYTNDEIENIFADIEKALHSAKAKFTADTKQQRIDMFKSEFEREYTWLNGFMRNVYRFADKEAMISPETKTRSEERRVGKECRSRWSPYH